MFFGNDAGVTEILLLILYHFHIVQDVFHLALIENHKEREINEFDNLTKNLVCS